MFILTQNLKNHLVENHDLPAGASNEESHLHLGRLIKSGKITVEDVVRLNGGESFGSPHLNDLLGTESGTGTVRVKAPSERYSTTKSIGSHKVTGQPVYYEGEPACKASEKQLAKIGVWFKHFIKANSAIVTKWGLPVPQLSEHESQLLAEMYHDDRFCGMRPDGEWSSGQTIKEMKGLETKALLNDATSGGSSLVPFDFDEQVVTFPLLNGELMPFVDNKTTNRDEVQTQSIANPTVTWNISEGSEIPLFDTDSMITNITASVFPVSVAIEYGRDLEDDSPVSLGATLVELVGQVMSNELDNVIANGDGTTQPEGIFNASGTTAVASDNGNTGPPTVGDYESLVFGIAKQYRRRDWNPMFIANDTTYQRARGIAVSGTDERRVFGMDHQSYQLLEHRFGIENNLANTRAAFVAMKKFRLWRRAGLEIFFTNEGKELARKNQNLLVARGRYAGILTDGSAAAITTDAQT